ncbi:phosphatidylinositol 3 [Microdochium bolleyi]|uniref:Serine/threonine-protein kinase Tel1 n=1 Tax=Microdochium bolleyi TaxID=196109 RepID=A0A136JAU2_9PEZI|nr:phosphatidylinositol 3 [Microdochium bolleyi]
MYGPLGIGDGFISPQRRHSRTLQQHAQQVDIRDTGDDAHAVPGSRDHSALKNSSSKARATGLKDFIYIFKKSPASSFDQLADKDYHSLTEVLFQFAVSEKHTYYRSKSTNSTTAATSASRLSDCAEALRLALEYGAPKLKRKTLLAIVDHIVQTLPGPDGNYVVPLFADYIKSLATILACPTNVELLSTFDSEGWFTSVDFVVQVIEQDLQGSNIDSASARGSPAPGSGFTASLVTSTSRSAIGAAKRSNTGANLTTTQALAQCLLFLSQAPNAPVLERGQAMAYAAVQILQKRSFALSQMQPFAFATINQILSCASTDDIELANTLAADVLPLVISWWRAKTAAKDALLISVRVEMLNALSHLEPHLEYLVTRSPEAILLSQIDDLADVLWDEYSHRDADTLLQLDHLAFHQASPVTNQDPFSLGWFGLRPFIVDIESRWALVQTLAMLESLSKRSAATSYIAALSEEQPRKKQRTFSGFSRLRHRLQGPDRLLQHVALQVMPFFVSRQTLSVDEVYDLLSLLVGLLGHKDIQLSSWAMISCASLTYHPEACNQAVALLWRHAWQLTIRVLGMAATSRASSVLINSMLVNNIMEYSEIITDISSIVDASETNGPAVVVDSTLMLMSTLLQTLNHQMPNSSHNTCSRIIRWTFLRWDPADDIYISNSSKHSSPLAIYNLLASASGLTQFSNPDAFAVYSGSIGECVNGVKQRASLTSYILLLGDEEMSHHRSRKLEATIVPPNHSTNILTSHASRKLITELLYPKIDEIQQFCNNWSAQRDQNNVAVYITSDRLQNRESLQQCILGIVRPYLPSLTVEQMDKLNHEWSQLHRLLAEVSAALAASPNSSNSLRRGEENDMDIDDDFEGGRRESRKTSQQSEAPRRESALATSVNAFHADTLQRLRLVEILFQDKTQIGLVPTSFLTEFLARGDNDLLLCRNLVRDIVDSDLIVNPDDAYGILERLALLIGRPANSGCEVALDTCLDVMHGLMPMWSDGSQDLSALASDLYSFFLSKALEGNLLSHNGQKRFAKLLFRLTQLHDKFPEENGLEPTTTSLLNLMRSANIPVRFYIGEGLPALFGRFILKVHDEVFIDVLDSLPNDIASFEGISVRLFVLSALAKTWPTLLRRCVYHIFETPGNIPRSKPHATYCLRKISQNLGLKDPQELFDLFAPQLLYTWLENDTFDVIPFEIFGFDTLDDLLKRAQAEILALMVMRGQDDAVVDFATNLGVAVDQLFHQNFSKIIAYSMAHDISVPRAENGQSGEIRVRKVLGREKFLENIYVNFADIVTVFFFLMDQEDPIERAWAKDEQLTYAAAAMSDIRACGHSDVILAANQQPTYRAKYLNREMALLCSRTEYEMHAFWTPALVVKVARRLLDSTHVALGPLHACAVLRKIRVLVCLAGPHALGAYPLMMLLHCIRPFVVEPESADDALGLSRYLLEKGSASLMETPSFLAGYSLSILASLRVFLESTQSSTTQESQFKATMNKAQQFHAWFKRYLDQYESPLLQTESQKDSFKTITQSAAQIRSSGNAEKNTAESRLLLQILHDMDTRTALLDESSRTLALALLCGKFRVPSTIDVDVVGDDLEAGKISQAVWRSCHSPVLSDDFLAWAGRVIGRSFAASGHVSEGILKESTLSRCAKLSSGDYDSELALINLVQSLTTDSNSKTAGLAESALRLIVSEAASEGDHHLTAACQKMVSGQLMAASSWSPYRSPPSDSLAATTINEESIYSPDAFEAVSWSQNLAVHLAASVPGDILLSSLPALLHNVRSFALQALPFLLHLVLFHEKDKHNTARKKISAAAKHWFRQTSVVALENTNTLLNAILYLRTQKIPGETSIAGRTQWLEIDLSLASAAAAKSGMSKTALLLAEISSSESAASRSSRRSSAARVQDNTELLLDVFENIDDPDAYYGLSQASTLDSVLARIEYEKDGNKSLAFRGAQFDSNLRRDIAASRLDSHSLVGTLNNLGLPGIAHSLLQTQPNLDSSSNTVDSTFSTARRLEMWDLPAPESTSSPSVVLYKAYQGCYKADTFERARGAVYAGLSETVRIATREDVRAVNVRECLRVLATLTELDDALNGKEPANSERLLKDFETRAQWMKSGRYEDVSQILSCRQTTLSMLSQTAQLRGLAGIQHSDMRLTEFKSMVLSSGVYRYHQATQESLNIAVSLTSLVRPSEELGLFLDSAARVETASSLWDHGEMIPSIRMLQAVDEDRALEKQSIVVSRPDLLAKIGDQISIARLEKPENIQKNYLQPALKELKGQTDGKEAGKVYHQFARFCDEQLQNPDGLEDLARLQNLRRGKNDEVAQLKDLISGTKESQLKHRYQNHLAKARQWLELDELELRRVEQSRAEFVKRSLESYLWSLMASDEYNDDALRFSALWLERSGEQSTNDTVYKHITKVPTRKFAPLMNQLTSRLLDNDSLFQKLLADLVYRICVDHPYHGMYQIWSGTKTRTNDKDDFAKSRQSATDKISRRLGKTETSSTIWTAIDKTSKYYHNLATERDASRYKAGHKVAIADSTAGKTLGQALAKWRIPPPTAQVELLASRDYSHLPYIVKLESHMSIASGVSAPKIITAVGSNGQRFKQLVKGGNDDLRQDAIMEQVFASVSAVLKKHRATQQRNLGIRTYKVLPLTSVSGLIEFVSNTIPLHEYLMPAHERYYPKDLKGSHCRKEINNVSNKSNEVRVATYKKVTERFHPVMRYFFMENFVDPDEWFAKRTAYTRTTAAISILGHVLGLGDRHGHNILLDSKTGEVVHIDLGVAFEMGRVLPVPELVPFRMTRDIVDGMGITKTEGVFRRCCEFTLDALREESYSIMTILDVLRYDPLYSWSISPVRMAKLQDTRQADGADEDESEIEARGGGGKKNGGAGTSLVNEPSEADRALEVVRKKLSKTLSVTATVNELINQATDEKNLAVLYSGWAAYA